MMISPGTIFGRYEIRARIGAGGMGEVYRAEDMTLLRPVAVKFIRRHASSSEAERRFLREARAASKLSHPHIVTVYEIGETDDYAYIVMEYVEGRNLRDLMLSRSLDPEAALVVAAQLADALEEAHAHGVIHRDIKPENVVLSGRGQAKLLDFGLAKSLEAIIKPQAGEGGAPDSLAQTLTASGIVVGTVPYMSPEQIRQEQAPLDARTDIFSFGILLCEMLTGRHPFRGANVFEVAASIIDERAADVGPLDPMLPPEVAPEAAALLARLLEKDREKRPASFAEIKRELVRLRQKWPAPPGEHPGGFAPTMRLELSPAPRAREAGAPSRDARASTPAAPKSPPTVLVMPLKTLGAQGDSAFIGVGLASVLTTELSKIGGLSVLSGGGGDPTREGARTLGADILLEGEVMHLGQQLRITARLTDVENGRVLWGDQYRGHESDLFQIQDAVCESVASALKLNVTGQRQVPGARASAAEAGAANIEAFVLYSKGRAFLERHDVTENLDFAIQMFEGALSLEPDFALASAGLGEAFWRKYLATHEPEWVERAIKANDRALVHDPRQAQVYVSLGMVYHGTGRTDRAIEELRRAIELQPMNADAYAWLGRCYMNKGKMGEAVASFNRAIELRPGYWDTYNHLGVCYYRVGRYEEAAEQFRRVISFQPDNNQGYNNLGAMYCLLGRYEEAVSMHLRAIKIHPTPPAYTGLGTNYFYLGRYEEAIEAYRNAIQLAPANDLYHRNLGDAYLRVGRGEEARAQFERAVELLGEQLSVNQDDAELLSRLAICQAKLQRPADAQSSIERATGLEPHDTTVMYKSAVVHALTGQAEKSLEILARALAHGYSRAEAERDPDLEAIRARDEYKTLLGGAA